MKVLLPLIALLYGLSVSTVVAQSTGTTVTGTIRDSAGGVIVDADVQMLNIGSGAVLKTTSNSEGKYELGGLALGSYMLSIRSGGSQAPRAASHCVARKHIRKTSHSRPALSRAASP